MLINLGNICSGIMEVTEMDVKDEKFIYQKILNTNDYLTENLCIFKVLI
jgi:hypothetical protein